MLLRRFSLLAHVCGGADDADQQTDYHVHSHVVDDDHADAVGRQRDAWVRHLADAVDMEDAVDDPDQESAEGVGQNRPPALIMDQTAEYDTKDHANDKQIQKLEHERTLGVDAEPWLQSAASGSSTLRFSRNPLCAGTHGLLKGSQRIPQWTPELPTSER